MISILFEISIYACVIFTLIHLCKKICKDKMSPALHYAIWGLLIARLMLPFTLESSLHLITVPVEQAVLEQDALNTHIYNFRQNDGIVDIHVPTSVTAPTPSLDTGPIAPTVTTPVRKPIPWQTIVIAIWSAGFALMITGRVSQYIRLRRRLNISCVQPPRRALVMLDTCKEMILVRKGIRIICCNGLDSPALLFPNLILLPVELLERDDNTLRMALLHELMHIKRYDHVMGLLLMALQAVYWFHPLLWIAPRQIRGDMEMACDAMVLSALGQGWQKPYAKTLVALCGKTMGEHLLLGMALSSTKRIAEKRVRGIFLSRRSGRGAKMLSVLLCACVLIACFTTACQPTPEKDIVIGKDDQQMQDVIAQTGESNPGQSDMYQSLGAPKTWQIERPDFVNQHDLIANATVTLPGAERIPVVTAVTRDFTQSDVDMVLNTLFGDDAVYYERVLFTKEWLEQHLIELRQNELNETDPDNKSSYEESIAYFESLYQNAPNEADLSVVGTQLRQTKGSDTTGAAYEGVYATTQSNNEAWHVDIGNDAYGYSTHMLITNREDIFMGTELDVPHNVALTRELAGEQAKQIVEKINSELQLCHIAPVGRATKDGNGSWGWMCIFMRVVDGVPTAYSSEEIGMNMESSLTDPVSYESITVVMNDQGLAEFRWRTPMTVTQVDNENAQLISFDEIEQRAIEQLGRVYADTVDETGATVTVDRVELGMMRIAKQNSPEYYYAPVWNIFPTLTHSPEHEAMYSKKQGEKAPTRLDELLSSVVGENGSPAYSLSEHPSARGAITINALDGSVIDRYLGY